MSLLGTVVGQIRIDISQAIAAYAAVEKSHRATMNTLSKIAATADAVGNTLGIAGLAIAAGLGEAAREAANFNKEMDYFQAVSGASAAAMDAIRAKALQLDQTTMFSVNDIAQMFVQLAKSGESTQQILGGVADAAVNLAQAAQVPLTDATNDVVAAMSAFNLKTSDATHVANIFAGAANSSILNLSDLATALKYVGGVASQLGVSFQESTVALDLLGQAGIRGSMGGTELRQIMVSLLGTTKAGATELKKLNIITADGTNLFFDQTGKLKSLSTVFQILQEHMKGMNQEQQLAALKILFNNRALSAAAILTKDGAKGFAEMNAQISKTSAADVAAKRMDNLAGDTKKLTSSLKTMAIEAGQPLQNFLRSVVQSVSKLVYWFEGLSPRTQSNIIHFLAFTAAGLLVLSMIAKTVAFAIKMYETWQKLKIAGEFLGKGLMAVANGFKTLAVAMLENPIVLIAVAIIALGVAFYELYKHSAAFRKVIDEIGRAFKGAFEATVNWFKTLPRFFQHVWDDIKQWFKDGVKAVKDAFDSVVNFFVGLGRSISNGISAAGRAIVQFFENIPKWFSQGWEAAEKATTKFFTNLPYWVGYGLGYALGTLLRWTNDVERWAIQFGERITSDIITFFEKLPGEIWRFLVRAWNDFTQWGRDMDEAMQKAGQAVLDAVVNFFEKLPGRIMGFLDEAGTDIAKWGSDVWNTLGQWARDIYNTVVDWVSKLPGEIGRWFEKVGEKFGKWITDSFNSAVDWGSKVIDGVGKFLDTLPDVVGKIFDKALQAIEDAISGAFGAAEKFAAGLWDGFKKGLGINSPSFIEKAMFQITDTMGSETKKINGYVKNIQGLGASLRTSNPLNLGIADSMTGQLKQLQAIRDSMRGPTGYGLSSSTSSGGDFSTPTKVLEVNVYNPVAETTTATTTQQLRTLAAMGAF